MLYTGIDLHKRFSYMATVDESGNIVKEGKVINDPTKVLNYFSEQPDQHKAVCETTIGWYWLVDLLQKNNIGIELAHARKLKAIAQAKSQTDEIDAKSMAQLLRLNIIPKAFIQEPETRTLRDLMRARLIIVHRHTSTVNSIYRILEKFNVTDPDDLSEFYRIQFDQYQEQAELIKQHIKHIEKTVESQIILDKTVQKILWIPGIGKINALTIYLEIGDIHRFPSESKFFSYARLVPGAKNSAGKTKHNFRESKAGNRYLKIAFNNAAVDAFRVYPEIRSFYQSKCRKKNKHLARNLVAKEIARIVYHVLYNDVDYDFTFKGKKLSKAKECYWPRPVSP